MFSSKLHFLTDVRSSSRVCPDWKAVLVAGAIGLVPSAAPSSDGPQPSHTAIKASITGTRAHFSLADAIKQNTMGMSEGAPAGVPRSYNWFKGWSPGGDETPPEGFTAVTGWGQVYQDLSRPTYTNPDARIEVANVRTYVHLRAAGGWLLVQHQDKHVIAGGHFVPDYVDNIAQPMQVASLANGVASFAAPPDGYNNHFWPTPRGRFAAGEVDAVYVQMDMRSTDPGLNLIANVGADWWLDDTAPYLHDHSNNPGAGSSNWVVLSTEWRTLAFFSSRAVFKAQPPPPLDQQQ